MAQRRDIFLRRVISMLMLICTLFTVAAQTQRADTLVATVCFRQSLADLDPDYMNNREALDAFLAAYRAIPVTEDPAIHIIGYASPEGSLAFNRSISQRRADALAEYLSNQLNVPASKISTEGAGVDWAGLVQAVENDPNVPKRDKVLEIVSTLPDVVYDAHGHWVGGRKHELMRLNAGRTWNYLMENVYPDLRNANAKIMCIVTIPDSTPAPVITEADTVQTIEEIKEMSAEEQKPEPLYEKYPVFAFRSNLLVPLLNVGVEIPVAKHWSIGADYYYPWIWPAKDNKNCFELIFVSAEVRYWFNTNRNRPLPDKNYLEGHSIGAYGAWGYYDFERNFHGYQGHGWSAGLDYMYALPVAKGRLRLEFQLAVGFVWSNNAQPYNVYTEGGHLIRERGLLKNFFYFGPTKVGVSLVLPINRKVQLHTPVQP